MKATCLWSMLLAAVVSSQALLGYAKAEQSDYISNEHRLMSDLMENYTSDVRPVNDPSDKVNLQLGISLINLDGLDEGKGILYLNTWLRMSWLDVQLKWDPSEYGGVKSLRIDVNKLWQPDITLYNSYSDFSNAIHKTLAVVFNNGHILWIPPAFFASSCPIDLTDFPYDTQICKLRFGSWTYSGNHVNLTHYEGKDSVDTTDFVEHSEFSIEKTEATLNNKYYACCPEPYQDLTYTLHLKRIRHSINHMIVTPCILLNFFLPVIFLLPPESEEKIHFGVGFLVANTILLMLVVDIIGLLHLVVPPLANYHLLNIALSCLALALSAVIRNLWAKGQRGCRLPNILKNYVLGIFGRMMCVSRDAYMPVGGTQPDHIVRQRDIMASDTMEEEGKMEDDREVILRNFARNAQIAEWKQLAVMLDRLGFLIFFIISVITTIALMTK